MRWTHSNRVTSEPVELSCAFRLKENEKNKSYSHADDDDDDDDGDGEVDDDIKVNSCDNFSSFFLSLLIEFSVASRLCEGTEDKR